MKNNDFLKLHETFTDESNTVIKVDDLIENIKNISLEEQNMLLMQALVQSEKQNKVYFDEIKNRKEFYSKRKFSSVDKRKVIAVKKTSSVEKKIINDTINNYNSEIEKIIKLNFEDFQNYVRNLSNLDETSNYYMLGILREIAQYNKIADEAYLASDTSFILEIKSDVLELNKKLNFLKQMCNIQPKFDDVDKKYRIIFFETSSLRSYFLEDIIGNKEHYNSFKELFNSIENGNPLKSKRFTDNDIFKGLIEARDLFGMTRIFFDKLDDNTYIIINAIIKKVSKSSGYKTQLALRYKKYLQQKNYIINQLNNEEFMERQAQHLSDIERLFEKDYDVMKKTKIKSGGN